jgi:hypothetical protein
MTLKRRLGSRPGGVFAFCAERSWPHGKTSTVLAVGAASLESTLARAQYLEFLSRLRQKNPSWIDFLHAYILLSGISLSGSWV